MANFAKINNNNEVLTVVVCANTTLLDENNIEQESLGQQWLETHNDWPANLWIKTSYNTINNKYYDQDENGQWVEGSDQTKAFRGNYAGIGYSWDAANQIFWIPQPYNSWIKDITTASWKSPIGDAPAMTQEQINEIENLTHLWEYRWNESNQAWDLIDMKTQ